MSDAIVTTEMKYDPNDGELKYHIFQPTRMLAGQMNNTVMISFRNMFTKINFPSRFNQQNSKATVIDLSLPNCH